mmetsp:Transcript_39317/g.70822  ORF Transcript_39317/g.70822 Transcript_39317/m.70822 type:complete len:355 (-) Transcript_39317:170-1234(-)
MKSYIEFDRGATTYTESICLPEGEYEFTFYDRNSRHYHAHYNIRSNGVLISKGGGFISMEAARFLLPFVFVPSAVPSLSQTPSSSSFPSISMSPSMTPSTTPPSTSPSLSSSPTDNCSSIEINVLPHRYRNVIFWGISTIATVDGTTEKNLVYDSHPIDLLVEGETYSAVHVGGSATETSVNGVLCDCGVGTSQCQCLGGVCLIERRDEIYFNEKVSNCEGGGGLAAIIYPNGDDIAPHIFLISSQGLGGGNVSNIPGVFISQTNGQYLIEHGLGEVVAMTVSSSLKFDVHTLNSRRVCLPEGEYEFEMYDTGHDNIYGDGHYNVTTSKGELIVEGRQFPYHETTRFALPFVPS